MARRKKQNEEDQSPENTDNTDDTFGLPEIEYEPLKRDEASETSETPEATASEEQEKTMEYEREQMNQENTYYNNDDDDDRSSPWPKILGILALLLIAGGAFWYFYYKPRQIAAEKAKQEQAIKDEEARKAEENRLAEQRRLDEEQRKADSLANAVPKEGEIETLSGRTGRYYVVIASAIDGDLIMDYAKKLSPKGVSSKIIPPFGKVKFYRLAVAEGDTYASTQETADGMKGEYGSAVWVIKY